MAIPHNEIYKVLYEGKHCDSFYSSNIEGFSYDIDSEELYVEFHGGRSYRYDGVPVDVVEDWCNAASMGEFHAANIKYDFVYTEL